MAKGSLSPFPIKTGGDTEFQEFMENLSPLLQEDLFSSFSPGKDEAPIPFQEQAEEETTASHANPAQDQEDRAAFDTRIKGKIDAAIERSFKAYCNRPSVAKRFPKIHCPSLDFSALAKHLSQDELELDFQSREQLLDLFKFVQNTNNIKSLFDNILKGLSNKP